MGKSTISMAIFNCYFDKLPEGNPGLRWPWPGRVSVEKVAKVQNQESKSHI